MLRRFVAGALRFAVLLAALPRDSAAAQQADSAEARTRTVRFTGTIASLSTTKPVSYADVRLIYIDSVHANKDSPKELGEVFVDSLRSRVGITDTTGAFAIRNVTPGHYLINVRRIGFEPFEGVLTIDTLPIDMELALTQIAQILPRVTISSSDANRVTERLERMGFFDRSKMGTSGTFIDRGEIVRRKTEYVTDLLRAYGVSSNAVFIIDRMEVDWETLVYYPIELVIGMEIYRRRGSLPTEFDRTRGGANAMSNFGGSGGIPRQTVILWTYIP